MMQVSKTSFIASLCTNATIVVITLLVSFGMPLKVDQIAAITGAASFIGMLLTVALWTFTVPREKVLEALVGEDVVAGPANDLAAEGDIIRQIPRRSV